MKTIIIMISLLFVVSFAFAINPLWETPIETADTVEVIELSGKPTIIIWGEGDADVKVNCFDAGTGETEWAIELPYSSHYEWARVGDKVFWMGADGGKEKLLPLVCTDVNGNILWQKELPGAFGNMFEYADPKRSRDLFVAGGPILYRLNSATGEEKWSFIVPDDDVSTLYPSDMDPVGDDVIFVNNVDVDDPDFREKKLTCYAVDLKTGKLIERFPSANVNEKFAFKSGAYHYLLRKNGSIVTWDAAARKTIAETEERLFNLYLGYDKAYEVSGDGLFLYQQLRTEEEKEESGVEVDVSFGAGFSLGDLGAIFGIGDEPEEVDMAVPGCRVFWLLNNGSVMRGEAEFYPSYFVTPIKGKNIVGAAIKGPGGVVFIDSELQERGWARGAKEIGVDPAAAEYINGDLWLFNGIGIAKVDAETGETEWDTVFANEKYDASKYVEHNRVGDKLFIYMEKGIAYIDLEKDEVICAQNFSGGKGDFDIVYDTRYLVWSKGKNFCRFDFKNGYVEDDYEPGGVISEYELINQRRVVLGLEKNLMYFNIDSGSEVWKVAYSKVNRVSWLVTGEDKTRKVILADAKNKMLSMYPIENY